MKPSMFFGPVCSGKKKNGRPAIELLGQRFGRLLVVARVENDKRVDRPTWLCKCDCGQDVTLFGGALRQGRNKSCGCFRRDRMGAMFRSHGKSKTRAYTMFYDARKRAAKMELPFDLEPDRIDVPETCPILGIALDCSDRDHTPSLDRITPAKGYTHDNTRVISFRANRFKSDATAHEHELIAAYIRNGGGE